MTSPRVLRIRRDPFDPEAESNVLGAAMLDAEAAVEAVALLSPDDFFDTGRRAIFAAITDLVAAGEGVDATTVADQLRRRGALEEAGGKARLLDLVGSCPSPKNVASYARIVRTDAEGRRVITVAQVAAAEVFEGTDLDVVKGRVLLAFEPSTQTDGRGPRLLTVDELDAEPQVEYVAEGFVCDRALNVLYGPTGAFKSFLALDLACSVAAALPWFGDRAVRSGPVVYIAAEGVAGLRQRLAAWRAQNARADLSNLRIVPEPVQLLDRDSVARLIAVAAPLTPRLVVVDTFARCIVGADENAAKDVGVAVAALDRVRIELDAAILVIHHTGHDTTRERGSTALRAAADAAIAVTATGDAIVAKSVKQKDAVDPRPLHLRRVVVDVPGLAHDDGSPVTSVVLEETNAPLSDRSEDVLKVLRECDPGDGLSATKWEKIAIERGVPHSSFYAALKALVDAGEVRKEGPARRARYRVSDQGELALDG